MTSTGILNALFGAALVALGVVAAAVADRIRGLRVSRERSSTQREPSRVRETPAPIEVVETARPRTEAKMQTMAAEVVSALLAAGYKKPTANEAVWGCSAQERASIETWTRAALRRCAKGGLS